LDCNVNAAAIIVDLNGNGDYTSIQEAIDNANPGDIIYVWNGTYHGNITIDKELTLIGNDTQHTIINGTGLGDVVYITASWVNISGFTIQNSGINDLNSQDSGIRVNYHYDYIHIYNNFITKNFYGIFLKESSDYNIIENNIIVNNKKSAIYCDQSDSNLIIQNNCSNNNDYGIYVWGSSSNSILNNTCNFNNRSGMVINRHSHIIKNNTCTFNIQTGITIVMGSYNNMISNNMCNFNNKDGIFIDKNNNYLIITNNTCNLNWNDGIEIKESAIASVINNTCNSNWDNGLNLFKLNNVSVNNNTITSNENGIILFESNYNIFYNNTLNINNKAIQLFKSSNNEFMQNNCNNNEYGFYLEQTNSNIYNENIISSNSNSGISILSNCNDNLFYHNQFLFNTKQISDSSNNNYSYKNEGNYWSDYSGLDNGANGRWKGDGIGDTKIPHPGPEYDNHPFVKNFGWQYPAIPKLILEAELDSDGNYTVSWTNNSRADGFILEEDTEVSFNSPTIYTEGWVLKNDLNVLNYMNKKENTYYYRIKSFNDLEITGWSDIVNVTVDYLPEIPKNLRVESVPDGNTLKITWDLNLKDTIYYNIFCFHEKNWRNIVNITHPTNNYINNGLDDGTLYIYRVRAPDFQKMLRVSL
jgi:parallel beta-helix repeat protein